MGPLKAWAAIALCGPAALLALQPAQAAAALGPGQLEKAIKASYLTKFGPFVEWPERSAAASAAPVRLCLIGKDPFGTLIDEAVKGQRIRGRPVALSRMDAIRREDAAECQILYIGAPTTQGTGETLQNVGGLPILTITDPGEGVTGGIIQFRLYKGRVQFEVDDVRARDAGLEISAKLLELAVKVKRK